MKTTAKTIRGRKRPKTVVDHDRNIFNPFEPLLTYLRRGRQGEEGGKTRSFRHDFVLVMLLHVFAILAFFAHGSIKRYQAAQTSKPIAAKKETPSLVEKIVSKEPEFELLPAMDAKPNQPPFQAVREPDPFKSKETTAATPTRPARLQSAAAPRKESAKQVTAVAQQQDKRNNNLFLPAASTASAPTGSASRESRKPINEQEENKKRVFLEATGRQGQTQGSWAAPSSAPETEIRRAEPVPQAPAPRPFATQGTPRAEPVSQPLGAIAWSTTPVPQTTGARINEAAATALTASHYTVEPGDNLEVISRRLEVDYNDLAAANSLSNSRDLRVGQMLAVPARRSSM